MDLLTLFKWELTTIMPLLGSLTLYTIVLMWLFCFFSNPLTRHNGRVLWVYQVYQTHLSKYEDHFTKFTWPLCKSMKTIMECLGFKSLCLLIWAYQAWLTYGTWQHFKAFEKSFNVFAKHVILWRSLLEKKRDLLLTPQEWEKNYASLYLRHSHTCCLGLATNIILTLIKLSWITIPQFLALQVINFLNIISTYPHMILISNYKLGYHFEICNLVHT